MKHTDDIVLGQRSRSDTGGRQGLPPMPQHIVRSNFLGAVWVRAARGCSVAGWVPPDTMYNRLALDPISVSAAGAVKLDIASTGTARASLRPPMPFDGPQWFELSYRDGFTDEDATVKLKTFGFETLCRQEKLNCPVWFELQGVLFVLVPPQTARNMKVSKVIAKLKEKFARFAEMFGSSFEDAILPSRRAWPNDERMHPCARQEFQTSTVGLFALFFYWHQTRHSLSERAQAKELCIRLFRKFFDGATLGIVGAARIPPSILESCPARSDFTEGVCIHVDELLDREKAMQDDIGYCMWELLEFLQLRAPVCSTLASWLEFVLTRAADEVNRRIPTHSSGDALKNAALHETGRGRKRRVDEDYIAALGAASSEGRGGNSSCIARALGDIDCSVANKHDEKFLREYNSAGHLLFEGVQECGLTYDASRLGQPPEETVMFCLERLDRGVAMWLPPQVPSAESIGIISRTGRAVARTSISDSAFLADCIFDYENSENFAFRSSRFLRFSFPRSRIFIFRTNLGPILRGTKAPLCRVLLCAG